MTCFCFPFFKNYSLICLRSVLVDPCSGKLSSAFCTFFNLVISNSCIWGKKVMCFSFALLKLTEGISVLHSPNNWCCTMQSLQGCVRSTLLCTGGADRCILGSVFPSFAHWASRCWAWIPFWCYSFRAETWGGDILKLPEKVCNVAVCISESWTSDNVTDGLLDVLCLSKPAEVISWIETEA